MKPERCPIATWDLEETDDKRTIQPEKNKCYFPAVVVRNGCPDNIYTSGMFKCPETHTDGGDYLKCDLFSIWWWYHFGDGKREVDNPIIIKTKSVAKPEIKISKGDMPLTSPNEIDRKSSRVAKNWNKIRIRKP